MYGELVRRARTERDLTQGQLAEISGMEQSNISAIETGRRMPTAETLHRLLSSCGFELVAQAGDRELALPPPLDASFPGEPFADDGFTEPPAVTRHTPMDVRVRVLNAALDTSEAIVRSR